MDKLKILIVEDDSDSCDNFAKAALEYDDISIAGTTNNSTQALALIKEHLPNVLILDIELHIGGGSGIDVLSSIKNSSLPINPYIIVTTNNSSKTTHDIARYLGADLILFKHQKDYSEKYVLNLISLTRPVILNKSDSSVLIPTENISPESQSRKILNRISAELDNVGISPKFVGRQYLIDAIAITIENPIPNICNIIGQKHKKTASSVERAMQNAIDKAWKSYDTEDLLKYYTARINPEKGKPTISEFIFYYADKIKRDF